MVIHKFLNIFFVDVIVEAANNEKAFEAVCEVALEACQIIFSQEIMK